jgi:hypothetical protein
MSGRHSQGRVMTSSQALSFLRHREASHLNARASSHNKRHFHASGKAEILEIVRIPWPT